MSYRAREVLWDTPFIRKYLLLCLIVQIQLLLDKVVL